MKYTIKQGMNQETLKQYPDNHFDSIVTDPPYGIEFLGKDWDSNTGAIETWEQCYRVLKPGGHMLAFSAARTYHHLATNIESVGFEIRDQLMWIYGSGFPKAQDIGKAIQKRQGVKKQVPSTSNRASAAYKIEEKYGNQNTKAVGFSGMDTVCTSPEAQQWSGWKTTLKPGHEPIVMARKPFKGSAIDNVLKHGTGALNIDATRIGDEVRSKSRRSDGKEQLTFGGENANSGADYEQVEYQGRYPSNVFGEIPDYQKYFYCPKVSRGERHCGFETNNIPTDPDGMLDKGVLYQHTKGGSLDHIATIDKMIEEMNGKYTGDDRQEIKLPHMSGNIKVNGISDEYAKWCGLHKNNAVGKTSTGMFDKNGNVQTMVYDPATHNLGNNHPTVKPVALMSYLVKLVTPPGGSVLDPFNGSGSTGMACVEHGFEYTGCELDPAYVEIATKRIEGWYAKTQPDNNFNELFEGDKQ